MKYLDDYRGWAICRFVLNGKRYWRAMQHGVTMNTNSEEGIKRMVDAKIATRRDNDRAHN